VLRHPRTEEEIRVTGGTSAWPYRQQGIWESGECERPLRPPNPTSYSSSPLTPTRLLSNTLFLLLHQVCRAFRDDLLGPGSDAFWRERWIECRIHNKVLRLNYDYDLQRHAEKQMKGRGKQQQQQEEQPPPPPDERLVSRSLALWLERHSVNARPKLIALWGDSSGSNGFLRLDLLELALNPFLTTAVGIPIEFAIAAEAAQAAAVEAAAGQPVATRGSLASLPPPTRFQLPHMTGERVLQVLETLPPGLVYGECGAHKQRIPFMCFTCAWTSFSESYLICCISSFQTLFLAGLCVTSSTHEHNTDTGTRRLLESLPRLLPSLEFLDLEVAHKYYEKYNELSGVTLSALTALSRLTLSGQADGWRETEPPLYATLPALVDLHIDASGMDAFTLQPEWPLTLTRLRSRKDLAGSDLPAALPALRELSFCTYDAPNDLPPLPPSLTSLSLTVVVDYDEEFKAEIFNKRNVLRWKDTSSISALPDLAHLSLTLDLAGGPDTADEDRPVVVDTNYMIDIPAGLAARLKTLEIRTVGRPYQYRKAADTWSQGADAAGLGPFGIRLPVHRDGDVRVRAPMDFCLHSHLMTPGVLTIHLEGQDFQGLWPLPYV
jgi:hypothetical protein